MSSDDRMPLVGERVLLTDHGRVMAIGSAPAEIALGTAYSVSTSINDDVVRPGPFRFSRLFRSASSLWTARLSERSTD